MEIDKLLESVNIAEKLKEDELTKIGNLVVEEFDLDQDSREMWLQKQEQWSKLALQVVEAKEWPWRDAANVKYPLLTIAALQFGARAYPSLIPNDGKIVKARTIGKDDDGQKALAANMVSKHMSFQLMEEVPGWEEGMDKLLTALPITGCMFKKTYYDPLLKTNCSHIVFPKHLVVNYFARDLESASRVTEILEKYPNEIKERQNAGLFRDIDLTDPSSTMEDVLRSEIKQEQGLIEPSTDVDMPRIILEQHRFLDLDDDGYKEPYVVTVDYDTKKVLRIVARYYQDGIIRDAEGKLERIVPTQYYTKFPFIPNPDGGFYDVGFGELLGPINHTVNTIINQLIDAGTLSNLQSGFLGRGIRMKGGEQNFRPGEWKVVNSTGDDLRKSIVPLPVREPSSVLFQLLGTLIQSGKELSTISEIMVGKMPGQNTPATTTMAAIEQGLKVFTAIYKRLFRALGEEFKKLYKLNKLYMSDYTDFYDVSGVAQDLVVTKEQYQMIKGVIPGADANVSSEAQRLAKSQALMELFPVIPNKGEVLKRVLEAQEQPAIEVLMQAPQQQGPSKEEMDFQLEQQRLQIEQQKVQNLGQLQAAQAELANTKAQVEQLTAQMQMMQQHFDNFMQQKQAEHQQGKDMFDALLKQKQHEDNQYNIADQTALKFHETLMKRQTEEEKAARKNQPQ